MTAAPDQSPAPTLSRASDNILRARGQSKNLSEEQIEESRLVARAIADTAGRKETAPKDAIEASRILSTGGVDSQQPKGPVQTRQLQRLRESVDRIREAEALPEERRPVPGQEATPAASEVFIRPLSKQESVSKKAKDRAWQAIPERDGYETVFKPYGTQGTGFYYAQKESQQAEIAKRGMQASQAQPADVPRETAAAVPGAQPVIAEPSPPATDDQRIRGLLGETQAPAAPEIDAPVREALVKTIREQQESGTRWDAIAKKITPPDVPRSAVDALVEDEQARVEAPVAAPQEPDVTQGPFAFKPGHKVLFRGASPETKGTWFTTDFDYALKHAKNKDGGHVAAVQVPIAEAEKHRTPNQHYILPEAVANGAVEWKEAMQQKTWAEQHNETIAKSPVASSETPKGETQAFQPIARGTVAEVKTPRGTSVTTQYALAEAEQLVVSNDDSGRVNPLYPTALQPRDRTRQASSLQIQRIAGNLDPTRLAESPLASQGAPIVGEDGTVESGNGRVLALRKAYGTGQAESYKRYLTENAERFGLDPKAIEAAKNPVLVRARTTPLDDAGRSAFARESNAPDVAGFSPVEQAFSDASRIRSEDFDLYQPDESGNVLAASNQRFVQSFSKGLTDEERGSLMTSDGRPTKQFSDRVRSAAFARAYNDERLLGLFAEEADPDIRNITSALSAAVPEFVRARSRSPDLGELDIARPLVEAADIVRSAKNAKQDVGEFLSQRGLFEQRDPASESLAKFMGDNYRSSKRMGAYFRAIAGFTETEIKNRETTDIFGARAPATFEQVVESANRYLGERYGIENAIKPDLFRTEAPRPAYDKPPDAGRLLSGQPPEGARAAVEALGQPGIAEGAPVTARPGDTPKQAALRTGAAAPFRLLTIARGQGGKLTPTYFQSRDEAEAAAQVTPGAAASIDIRSGNAWRTVIGGGALQTRLKRRAKLGPAPGETIPAKPNSSPAKYSFAGERGAKTPKPALATARKSAEQGVPMEEIRNTTGWFRAKDDKWRFEISDKGAKLKPEWDGFGKKAGDVLDHPTLFENYPSLKDIEIDYGLNLPEDLAGGYDPNANTILLNATLTPGGAKSTLLHEMQHAVQVIEGFARGGSPNDKDFISAAAAMGIDTKDRPAMVRTYKRLLGEVEARDVQARMNLTAEQLRERPPYVERGIPESDFIVRQGEGGFAASTAQTETPEFKRWFGASQVVNEKGEPLVVFHGTNADISTFKPGLDGGIHLGTKEQTNMRVSGAGKNLLPLYVNIEKPRRGRDLGGAWKAKIASAKATGHDGIVYLNRYEGITPEVKQRLQERGLLAKLDGMTDAEFRRAVPEAKDSYIAFRPEQVKSAIGNRGTFDPANPDISYSIEAETGQSVSGLRANLAKRLGSRAIEGLERAGFSIIEQENQLPKHLQPQGGEAVRGVHDPKTGKSYLVAGSIPQGTELGVLLHEVGVHAGMEGLLGPELYADVMRQIKNPTGDLALAVKDAKARIPNDTRAEHVTEETLAYLVENAANRDLPLVRRILAAIRAWLLRHGFKLRGIREEDLVALARASVRAVSRGEGVQRGQAEPLYSRAMPLSGATPAETSAFAEENRRLREDDKTTWDRAKKFWTRNFTPGGLLPEQVFAQKNVRDGELGVIELDTENLVAQLDHAVKAVYGKRMEELRKDQRGDLQEALTGKVVEGIDIRARTAIVAMRQHIDRMSSEYIPIIERQIAEMTASGDPAAEAKAGILRTITGNLGRYVHRSYRAFDDPQWFSKLPNEVIDSARKYLRERNIEEGMDSTEAAEKAERALHTIVKTGTAYDSMESFVREGKLGAKDLSILIRRKDIAPEIRALLGEHDDPRLNYAKSTSKMARLIWNTRFLDRVREIGMGTFLFEEKDAPPGTIKIAADSSEVHAPLNGLFTFPDIDQAFKDAVGKDKMDNWYRVIVQMNGAVKYGKTILSPTTQIRNFMSSAFFSLANGHFDMRHIAKSVDTLRGKSPEYARTLTRLGIIDNGAYAGEVMQLINDSKIEDILRDKKSTPYRVWRDLNAFAKKAYRNGDDFWKIIGFENEKALLMGAGVDEAQAEREAAERIRNTYPTYSMVGRGIKWLARFPLAGTFVSFPAEIIRTSAHMLRYVAKDYQDPKRRPLAIRRAVGLSMVSGFAYALQAMTKAMVGMDDEEEEAVRLLAAPWQRNSNFLFTGRDEKGQLRYFDLSFLDPYNWWKRPITAILRDQPWEDKATGALRDMLSPFLGTDIAAGSIFEVLSNKKESGGPVFNEFADPVEQSVSIADHLRKALQPGFVSNMERTYRAASGDYSPSGKKYNLADEGMSWIGWRVTTLEPKTALHYRSFEFADAKRAATATLARTLTSPNKVSRDDIASAKADAERQLSTGFRDMHLVIEAALKNGLSRPEVIRVLRTSGVSLRDIPVLLAGREPRLSVSPQQIRNAQVKARSLYGPEKAAEIRRRYRDAERMMNF